MVSDQARLEVVDRDADSVVARVAGDLDILTAEPLKLELAGLADEDGVTTLILDLVDIGFVDSSGLGALVGLHRRIESQGGRLAVRSVPPPVQRLFEITGLNDLFQVADSHEDLTLGGRTESGRP